MTRALRDTTERVLRAWNRYEIGRGAAPVIDYDCHPVPATTDTVNNRLEVYTQLSDLRDAAAAAGDSLLAQRIDADVAYCSELLGARAPLADYVQRTQGCVPRGWSDAYLHERRELAQKKLADLGVRWGADTATDLVAAEGTVDNLDIADAIRDCATHLEPAVRAATGTDAAYQLAVELVDEEVYWSYWLDGAGSRPRLRVNRKRARFTRVAMRQFALHEVLGHALQFSSLAQRCAASDVPWVRLTSVHSPYQILFEGLAQAFPLMVTPDDQQLAARVHLDHYQQLVRGQLHLRLAAGEPLPTLADSAREQVPFWTETQIANDLSDRGANVLLRSYMWSYSAGVDWFVRLAETSNAPVGEVLHAVYQDPHTPEQLMAFWPAGPRIGSE